MIDNRCPSCGQDVQPTAGPGRPPTYCGEACRRAAEFEIRRLNRRLERLEDQATGLELRLNTPLDPIEQTIVGVKDQLRGELDATRHQIEVERRRLRELLA